MFFLRYFTFFSGNFLILSKFSNSKKTPILVLQVHVVHRSKVSLMGFETRSDRWVERWICPVGS